MQYRNANQEDLQRIAEVLLAAFPESVQHYVGRPVAPRVIADVFAICLDAEPDALFVAVLDGKVAGYIFAPARLSHLFRVAVLRGHLLRMFWRWITGQYGIGVRPTLVAIRNWFYVWRESQERELQNEARILSIAVDPSLQGLGIGSELVRLGLEYLRQRGAAAVRLEVRPDNAPARHIYEKLGFQIRGRTRDTQGDWLIMFKNLSRSAEG